MKKQALTEQAESKIIKLIMNGWKLRTIISLYPNEHKTRINQIFRENRHRSTYVPMSVDPDTSLKSYKRNAV